MQIFKKTPYLDHLETYQKLPHSCDLEVVRNSIIYYAKHPKGSLGARIQGVFSSLSETNQKDLIKKVTFKAVEIKNLELLETISEIAPLKQIQKLYKQESVTQSIKTLAKLTQKPESRIEIIKSGLVHQASRYAGLIAKITNFATKTFFLANSIDFEKVPKTQQEANMQLYNVFAVSSSVFGIASFFLEFCTTMAMTAVIGVSAVIAIGLGYYLYNKYKMGTPENIDSKFFRNLNIEAKTKRFKTIGRTLESDELEKALSCSFGDIRPVPILIGPPGVGKTQLVEGLANRIIQGKSRALANKQILMINSANLGGVHASEDFIGTRLEGIFAQLQGHENDFILFFDEAHALAKIESTLGSRGASLLEVLKSKFLEVPVQYVLATTSEEFQKYLARDEAFLSRLKQIELKSFTREEAKSYLLEKYGFDQKIVLTEDSIEAILDANSELDDSQHISYNPRKLENYISSFRNELNAWKPKKLERLLETKFLEINIIEERAKSEIVKNSNWLSTDQGLMFSAEFEQLNNEKQALEEKYNAQAILIKEIDETQVALANQKESVAALIHSIVEHSQNLTFYESALKSYILKQNVLIPLYQERLKTKLEELEFKYHETMPLDINVLFKKQISTFD